METTRCTAFLEDGESRCGRQDDCTRVTIRAGGNTIRHWVCSDCRDRMDLPDEDVDLTAVADAGRRGTAAGQRIRREADGS